MHEVGLVALLLHRVRQRPLYDAQLDEPFGDPLHAGPVHLAQCGSGPNDRQRRCLRLQHQVVDSGLGWAEPARYREGARDVRRVVVELAARINQ
jgi:hypothetical protein